jgi:hypothetical protein
MVLRVSAPLPAKRTASTSGSLGPRAKFAHLQFIDLLVLGEGHCDEQTQRNRKDVGT